MDVAAGMKCAVAGHLWVLMLSGSMQGLDGQTKAGNASCQSVSRTCRNDLIRQTNPGFWMEPSSPLTPEPSG